MAGQYYTGTLLASPIVRGSSGDTYGTHHSVLGVGGYQEYGTVAERNAIPVDGIVGTIYYDGLSSGQRRLGMLVHVLEDDTIYQLHPKVSGNYVTYSQWMAYPDGTKYALLSDNNSWYPLFTTSSGATSNGENISKSIFQTTHSFVVGTVVGFTGGTSNYYVELNATTANQIEPLGIVTQVIDINNFRLTYAGAVSTAGMLDYTGGTLTAGKIYYLANTINVHKNLSKYSPTGTTAMSKPMLVALSGNTGVVLQYRGITQTQQGVTLAQFNTYTGNTQVFLNKTVTGATNIGYFSGKTGIQSLVIANSVNPAYNGTYNSVYNYYYRDASGIIRIGSPTYNGALRRGYVRTSPTPVKSWIYNLYTGLTNQVGWELMDGDVTTSVGTSLTSFVPTGAMYTNVTWSGGSHNNGGNVTLNASGSLLTGSTYSLGGPVFSNKLFQELRLRTIMSNSPALIKITYDDNFVYVSGSTTSGGTGTTTATNVGAGAQVFKSKTGSTLQFRTIVGSGNTTVSQVGDVLRIYSSGSSGGGTYNLASPSICPTGGMCAGTVLTGKTAFEILREILVPELCGTITAPSVSIGLTASGLYEIGCSLSQTVTGTFSRGSINPQYCSASPFRSGCAISYCFTGTGMPSGFQACASSPAIQTNPSYTVVSGTQSWGVCTCYGAGSPALGNAGTQYAAALSAGCTSAASNSIVGAYPLYGTTSSITVLTKQTLQNMATANNIQLNLVADSSPNKQKFEIPCAWLSSRPLIGVCQWNTVSSQWEYPGGSAGTSLAIWTCSAASETVQALSIGYCRYTYNSTDRAAVCIRLVF